HNESISETHKQECKELKELKELSSSSSTRDSEFAEVMNFYQSNLQRGLTESPFNLDLLQQFYNEFGSELLLAAMKTAAKAEAKGVNFVEGVLKNWREAGVRTIDDARKYEREFKENRGKSKVVKFNRGEDNATDRPSYELPPLEDGEIRLFK